MRRPFLRHNGYYYGIVRIRGKQIWRSLETRDPHVAAERFALLRLDMPPHRSKRISDFFREFLERGRLTYKLKTLNIYKWCFKDYLRHCRDKRLKDVTRVDAESFRLRRGREDTRPVSVNVQLRHLRCALGEAVRLGLIDRNPFEGVKPLRVQPKEAAFLAESDLRKLIAAIPDLEFRNIVVLAFLTAMRLSEIMNLRWEWVDFERQAIHVRNHGEFEVKGGKARWVPMNRWLLEYLQGKERRSEYVFPDEQGRLRNGTTVSRRFKRFVRKAGLDDSIHFHSLRHSGISYYINQGVSPAFVQRFAGHSSSKVTDKYVHIQDVSLLTAIRAVTTPSFN